MNHRIRIAETVKQMVTARRRARFCRHERLISPLRDVL